MHMNPVFKKELKMTARSAQLPALIIIFNSVLAAVVLVVLYCIRQINLRYGEAPYSFMVYFYMGILAIELCLFCLVVPSSASGSIAGERERQTLDILLASKMTVPGIIAGKMMSCISMACLLGISSIPVLAVTLMYGGIDLVDIYESIAYTGFLIIFIGCVGVFCSCKFKKTTFASVASYGLLVFLVIGTSLLVILLNIACQLSMGESWRSLLYYDSGVQNFHIPGLVYVLFLNPAVTFILIMCRQTGNIKVCESFLETLGAAETAASHWIPISLVVQTAFMIILFIVSVKYLDPLNERFRVGTKILKKHKRH